MFIGWKDWDKTLGSTDFCNEPLCRPSEHNGEVCIISTSMLMKTEVTTCFHCIMLTWVGSKKESYTSCNGHKTKKRLASASVPAHAFTFYMLMREGCVMLHVVNLYRPIGNSQYYSSRGSGSSVLKVSMQLVFIRSWVWIPARPRILPRSVHPSPN